MRTKSKSDLIRETVRIILYFFEGDHAINHGWSFLGLVGVNSNRYFVFVHNNIKETIQISYN